MDAKDKMDDEMNRPIEAASDQSITQSMPPNYFACRP
jgi:hypothetical protein